MIMLSIVMTVATFVFHVAAVKTAPKLCLDCLRSLSTDIFKLICLSYLL